MGSAGRSASARPCPPATVFDFRHHLARGRAHASREGKCWRFYPAPGRAPPLFGEWALVREWGRRGSPGTVRFSSYERRNEAETAEGCTIKRRLQHGYRAI
jgi:predicted DNA-binding WGR domain protein